MTERLADLLHTTKGALKRLACLHGPADLVQEVPERDFGSPILNRVSERHRQRQRFAQVSFGTVPVPSGAFNFAGQTPALDKVLARGGARCQIETDSAV